jgi:hypothetical protein
LIVSVDEHCIAGLRDPRDFKSFKLVAAHPASQRDAVAGALAGIGGKLEDEHAWIPIAWMRRRPGLGEDADWLKGLQGMLDFATRKGWVDEARGLVRAHIEWQV